MMATFILYHEDDEGEYQTRIYGEDEDDALENYRENGGFNEGYDWEIVPVDDEDEDEDED